MQTTWNLGLLYKNENDPAIEKDLAAIEAAYAAFEKKYRKADFTATPAALAKAFRDYVAMLELANGSKPWWYFALRQQLNAEDAHATATATAYSQRLSAAGNKTVFFSLAIGKIPPAKHKAFLKDPQLAPYAYFLKRIFLGAKHQLSEGEEQLEELLLQTSYTMWVDGQEKLLNAQMVEWKGEQIPIAEALALVADLPKKDRRALSQKVNSVFRSISHFAEAEINAVYTYKKVMDERRGYAKPYDATLLAYESDETAVLALVSAVTKHFKISRRFYALHARLLGEKKIMMADRNAKVGTIGTAFDFETSVALTKQAFAKIGQKYVDVLDSYIANGQIDVYPRKGKTGGGFCWGQGTLPTFVLLNHADAVRSVETLAHEMGHAIHTEFSKSQPAHYRSYSTATAEVASTFFEQVLIDELEHALPEKDRFVLLHNKISGDISTIFRQIACFNFELELHGMIRSKGQITAAEIAALLVKHMGAYLGDAVQMDENDGYFFVNWSHIRHFFYVYSYAYGQLVSRALYENWKRDPAYEQKIERFLFAGGSASPEDIFKSIGVDTRDPAFFEAGLKGIEADIKKLEKLAKKLGK